MLLVYTLILILIMYLEGAKNKSGFKFFGDIEVIFWPPETPLPLFYYMIFST